MMCLFCVYCFRVCREELRMKGVTNIEETLKKEFPVWFEKHVSYLFLCVLYPSCSNDAINLTILMCAHHVTDS